MRSAQNPEPLTSEADPLTFEPPAEALANFTVSTLATQDDIERFGIELEGLQFLFELEDVAIEADMDRTYDFALREADLEEACAAPLSCSCVLGRSTLLCSSASSLTRSVRKRTAVFEVEGR